MDSLFCFVFLFLEASVINNKISKITFFFLRFQKLKIKMRILERNVKLFCTLQVPGNLIISARSDAHSFDASQMNMSHVVNNLSFGKKVTPRAMSDVKLLIPYLGSSHDRLSGRSFSNTRDFGANVTVSSIFYMKNRKTFNLVSTLPFDFFWLV